MSKDMAFDNLMEIIVEDIDNTLMNCDYELKEGEKITIIIDKTGTTVKHKD